MWISWARATVILTGSVEEPLVHARMEFTFEFLHDFFYFHFGISASFCVITWDICNFWVHHFPLHYGHRAFIIKFIMHLISTMNSTRVLIFVMDESFSDWPIPVCLSRALNLLPFWPSVVIFLYMAKLFYAFFCLGLCSIIKDFWMFQQL